MNLSKLRRSIKKSLNLRNNQYISKFLDQNIRYNPTHYNSASALQLLEVFKVITDSFKPYKTTSHILADLFALPSALMRIVLGLRLIFNAIVSLPLDFINKLISAKPLQALSTILPNINALLNTIILSMAIISRGLIEIILSPLSLVRMPFRGLMTLKTGWPKFERNYGLNECLDEGEDRLNKPMSQKNLNELKIIIKHLNYKSNKANYNNQNSLLPKFKIIPHVDKNVIDNHDDYGLPEQENVLFLTALAALNRPNKISVVPAINDYFDLFRPRLKVNCGKSLRYAPSSTPYCDIESRFFKSPAPPSQPKPDYPAAATATKELIPEDVSDWSNQNSPFSHYKVRTPVSPISDTSELSFGINQHPSFDDDSNRSANREVFQMPVTQLLHRKSI